MNIELVVQWIFPLGGALAAYWTLFYWPAKYLFLDRPNLDWGRSIPLWPAVLGVVFGLILQSWLNFALNIWLIQCFLVAALLWLLRSWFIKKTLWYYAVVLLFLFWGGATLAWHQQRLLFGLDLVAGSVRWLAIVRQIEHRPESHHQGKIHLELWHPRQAYPSGWYVQMFAKQVPNLRINQLIKLYRPKPAYGNPGLYRNHVLGMIFNNRKLWSVGRLTKLTSYEQLQGWGQRKFELWLGQFSPLAKAMLATIFGGQKLADQQSQLLRQWFARWGVCHMLARSGLHVGILVGSWFWFLLRIFGLQAASFISWFLLILFATISWPSVSFWRAYLLFSGLVMARLAKRNFRALHFLSLMTLWLLLFNPWQLWALDFQLSFSLVAALFWSSDLLKN